MSKSITQTNDEPQGNSEQTPEEILVSSYQALRSELPQGILEHDKKCSAKFFED